MSFAFPAPTAEAPAPHRLYWTLQLFGWSAYAVGDFLVFASILDDPFPYLPVSLGQAAVGLALTHGYRQAVRDRQWADLSLWKLARRIALASAVLALVVKHGVAPNPGGGRVDVEARREDGGLRLRVANTAPPGGRTAPGGGVGLQNARGRLRLLYGEAAVLSLTEREGQEVVAEVWLPVAAPVAEGVG